MNELDIHPTSSQLLLLNGRTAYYFLFVDCCFWTTHLSTTVFRDTTPYFEVNVNVIACVCDLENSFTVNNKA